MPGEHHRNTRVANVKAGPPEPERAAPQFVPAGQATGHVRRIGVMVLDHPDIPLHTNGSENDIRCQVTKRQVSGGTHSNSGRNCRDAFLGLESVTAVRSEEHTSELQSHVNLVCRLLLEKKKTKTTHNTLYI